MFFFNPTKIAIAAAVALVLCGTVVGGFSYVSGLRADLAVSRENTHKLEVAVAEQQSTIERIGQEQAQIRILNQQLAKDVRNREKDVSNLRDRFDRDVAGRHRDFGQAAETKPLSIERAINKGTINAARCMEIASGAPLTEVEKNATTIDKINKECPSLANPSYVAPDN